MQGGSESASPANLIDRSAQFAFAHCALRIYASILPDGQFAHGGSAQIARRANLPQPSRVDPDPESVASFVPSCTHTRGASRSSRTLSAGCGGRVGAERRAAFARTAKSCGPGAPMQAPSCASLQRSCEATVAIKLVHRGEREISRKPLRREGRLSLPVPVVNALAQIFLCARAPGACGHPVFPAPSDFRGTKTMQSSGAKSAAGIWTCANAIARSKATMQSSFVGWAKRSVPTIHSPNEPAISLVSPPQSTTSKPS